MLRFNHYSTNDGLSQNAVFAILQDKDDFIWIGTEDGLNRFDGYDFTIYKQENKNQHSLSNSKINALLEDHHGSLWIATANGLNRYDRRLDQFERIPLINGKNGELDDFITSIIEDKQGRLWVGTLGGLNLYDSSLKKLSRFYSNISKKVADANKVRTIFEDNNNMLWVSIGDDLKRFDPERKMFLGLPPELQAVSRLRKGTVRVIKQDANGNFWFGTEAEGLFFYNISTKEVKNYKAVAGHENGISSNVVRDLFFRTNNELWVGTRDGLNVLNTVTDEFLSYKYNRYDVNTLSHNSVRHITRDRSGNIWLGTFSGGLNIYSPSNANFTVIQEQIASYPGLNFPVVGAILAEGDGGLWVGTEGGGLNYIDRKRGIFKNDFIRGPKYSIIKSLLKDQKKLWLGTFDGLATLNTATMGVTPVTLKKIKQSANNQVFALAKTDRGLWIGTDGQGLILLDKNGNTSNFVKQQTGKSISGNTVFSLLATAKQGLWIGTDKGLNFLGVDGYFKHYLYNESNIYSINHNAVSVIFLDSRAMLWVGTKGGGLNIFDQKQGRFYPITSKDGLANDIVHSIREDKSGNIWVSTNKGLSKLAIRNLKFPVTAKMYSIMNYAIADGLQGNQFSANASATTADGELLFGGINGITTFYPEKIVKNTYKPKAVITEMLIKNKLVNRFSEDSPLTQAISETEEIVLTNEQAFITLKFASLNFINPDKNKYAYKLEGFKDDDWHYVGDQRFATYTNLDAGNYVFKVKSANNDGLWNQIPTVLRIVVLPPWYKRWYAFLGYALIIGILLYFYYSYSIKTAELKNELVLESKIRENNQELYQRKLNFFTNISHEIKTPLTLILSPLEKLLDSNNGNNRLQNQLMLMKRNGEHLVRLINQLLDFRKFDSGNMELRAAEGNIVRFIREVTFAFHSYANHLNIDLTVKSSQKSIRVWFDRDMFEKIMYNLLSNALKFTKTGGQVIVHIEEFSEKEKPLKYVKVSVEDNGLGISVKNIGSIFEQFSHYDKDGYNTYGSGIGLAFTKGLVELHHGSISVASTEMEDGKNGYTCFTILLPIGANHLSDNEQIPDYKDSENIDAYHTDGREDIEPAFEDEISGKMGEAAKMRQEEPPVLLIVEDNQDVMGFLVDHFQDKFIVHRASDGKEGFKKAIELIPDMIISDVMMPEMNGTELCTLLKSDNRTSHIPIILLTARTPLIYKIEGFETGADDYITKPFSIKVVETRVWNLLQSRQQLRERYKREVTLQPTNMAITLPDEIFLEKVMAFIEKNMTEPSLNVEELGKDVSMSRGTLYRKIKALTNQTTIEFIRSVRLKKALQYLQTANYSVSEVGYLVGFTDIDYFRKCFKEQFGKTPKEFTRKSSEENDV